MTEAVTPESDRSPVLTPSLLQYDRTIIAFHGTDRTTADRRVRGESFEPSDREFEWLGTGMYFWAHAPKQAWRWATNVRKYNRPAVIGALIRLGNCFDLCDPDNVLLLKAFKEKMERGLVDAGEVVPRNDRKYKKLDCAAFNYVYDEAGRVGGTIDTSRGVYVPRDEKKRVWASSWIYEQTHIQICVRKASSILAVWHVREDGRYGIDP